MENVYNRGFWGGYYLGKERGEWTDKDGSKAKKRKVYVGDGVKYFGKIGIGEFVMKSGALHVGDDIIITGPTTGMISFKVDSLRKEETQVETVNRGDKFTFPIVEKIRPADKIYKIVDV